MNQLKKTVLIRILCVAFIFSNVFAQNAGLITQKINIENAIRDKVNVTVGKILDQSKFVIIAGCSSPKYARCGPFSDFKFTDPDLPGW